MAAAVFSNRVVRRRAIIYTVLLAVSFVLMAISSSPIVIELQKGVAYAFSPVQGVLDDTAGGAASIFRTIAEIDTLREPVAVCPVRFCQGQTATGSSRRSRTVPQTRDLTSRGCH